LVSDSGNYPPGTEIYLIFKVPNEDEVRWDAEIVGDAAMWFKTADEVAIMVDLEIDTAKLHYKVNGVDIVWYKGGIRDNT
jgi:hypothetical protein